MKKQRLAFMLVLFVIFSVSFFQMNRRYDPLARYQYADQANRDLIIEYMDAQDISYIIQQQIEPVRFEKYLPIAGFEITNIAYYELLAPYEPDLSQVVTFINKYKGRFTLNELTQLVKHYNYKSLASFYDQGSSYVEKALLETKPSQLGTMLNSSEVLWDYRPHDLVNLTSIPATVIDNNDRYVQVRIEVVDPLERMCNALEAITSQTCGNLIVVRGYTSAEAQTLLYEEALLAYGFDEARKYVSYPGQSEFQLGTTIQFSLPKNDTGNGIQANWLAENAHEYGFIIRYPEGKESVTGRIHEPLLLRYVGTDLAAQLYNANLTLEEGNKTNE
ncbi:MAG: M15 family metallopeptidase [Erysipelotrichaceae bacterium]